MKEKYEAPVVQLICFVSCEKLASNGIIDMDDLISLGGAGSATEPSEGDIDIKLK